MNGNINGDIDVPDEFNVVLEESVVGACASFGQGEHTMVISTVSGGIEISD